MGNPQAWAGVPEKKVPRQEMILIYGTTPLGDYNSLPDDFTPDDGTPCNAVGGGFFCTLPKGEHVIHAAGNGDKIIAVWADVS